MTKIICLYTSHENQTAKICNKILEDIQAENVEKINLIDQQINNINDYDKIIIAGSIRYGKFHKNLIKFITKNEKELNKKETIFISVNLVARKKEKSTPLTNPYTRKFLSQTNWEPKLTGVFAGACRYSQYNIFQKYLIKLIMKITKGPTDTSKDIEFTDWNKVKKFAEKIKNITE